LDNQHHLCPKEINYRKLSAELSIKLKKAGELERIQCKSIEIPELQWKIFKWWIQLENSFHFQE
jgi:hypothetical protein